LTCLEDKIPHNLIHVHRDEDAALVIDDVGLQVGPQVNIADGLIAIGFTLHMQLMNLALDR
jgi:hypothetical protein